MERLSQERSVLLVRSPSLGRGAIERWGRRRYRSMRSGIWKARVQARSGDSPRRAFLGIKLAVWLGVGLVLVVYAIARRARTRIASDDRDPATEPPPQPRHAELRARPNAGTAPGAGGGRIRGALAMLAFVLVLYGAAFTAAVVITTLALGGSSPIRHKPVAHVVHVVLPRGLPAPSTVLAGLKAPQHSRP